MITTAQHDVATPALGIQHSEDAPPVTIPPGHVGEFVIPGSGRRIWWTGRVAIGLLHRPEPHRELTTQSSLWIQSVMCARPRNGPLNVFSRAFG